MFPTSLTGWRRPRFLAPPATGPCWPHRLRRPHRHCWTNRLRRPHHRRWPNRSRRPLPAPLRQPASPPGAAPLADGRRTTGDASTGFPRAFPSPFLTKINSGVRPDVVLPHLRPADAGRRRSGRRRVPAGTSVASRCPASAGSRERQNSPLQGHANGRGNQAAGSPKQQGRPALLAHRDAPAGAVAAASPRGGSGPIDPPTIGDNNNTLVPQGHPLLVMRKVVGNCECRSSRSN